MNKKGLTLIELLGVIIVLGIIAAISFPAINGVINNSRKDAVSENANSFVNAALSLANEEYLLNDSLLGLDDDVAGTATATTVTITIEDLQALGRLESNFKGDTGSVTIELKVTNSTNNLKELEVTALSYSEGAWAIKSDIATSAMNDTIKRGSIIATP
jgi:prepilin-type N-terminal cleavage/methylation domain-containing protein